MPKRHFYNPITQRKNSKGTIVKYFYVIVYARKTVAKFPKLTKVCIRGTPFEVVALHQMGLKTEA